MRRLITASVAAGILALLPMSPALAHGDQTQGDLVIATGFVVEPAYAGQPNGVQLIIEHDGEPVIDLAPDALRVDVTFGDQTTTLTPEPAFEVGEWGTPGDYHAGFIPSAPGAYTFHVTGTIDGEDVDYEMTSGPTAFGEVEDPAGAMFPPVDEPSSAELAAKLEAVAARSADAAAAQSAADTARLLAIAAVIVAVIAIGLAISTRGRRDESSS
jgi:hypothetical protein